MPAARYAYQCPKCQATIELTTTQAGQEITCHSCAATITAPSLGAIKALPAVGENTETSKTKKAKTHSPVKSWLFVGGLLLATIAGIAGWAAQTRSNQFSVDFDLDKAMEQEFSDIDRMPPAEIYAITVEATKESFALQYREAFHRTFNKKSGYFQWIAWIFFALAGLGVLMVLGSFAVKS